MRSIRRCRALVDRALDQAFVVEDATGQAVAGMNSALPFRGLSDLHRVPNDAKQNCVLRQRMSFVPQPQLAESGRPTNDAMCHGTKSLPR